MKQYGNFNEAFLAANSNFASWSLVYVSAEIEVSKYSDDYAE